MKYDFDYDRAATLMDFIVEAGKHGPTYNVMMGMAQEELKEMLDEAGMMVKRAKSVTPPDGPANAAVAEVREVKPVERTEPFVMKEPAPSVLPEPTEELVDTPAEEITRRPV